MKISAVVNTHNEEKNITRCLKSLNPYVNEIVVVDMHSSDETRTLAKKFTDKIWLHEYIGYVEPARNFAITKATGDWILLLDADEEVPETLGLKLNRLVNQGQYDYFRIPRKNYIFGKWIKHSGWWPDYQIRFFKKDAVSWNNEIHSIPITQGAGMDLSAQEINAITHHHYNTIFQYIDRLNRYTNHEAKQLITDGYIFNWKNMIIKPANEFYRRFFNWEGYRDGIHGLALSFLQAVSLFVVELKIWELNKFTNDEQSDFFNEFQRTVKKMFSDATYWLNFIKSQTASGFQKQIYKIKTKLKI